MDYGDGVAPSVAEEDLRDGVGRPGHFGGGRFATPAFHGGGMEAMVAAGVIDEDERVELIGGDLVPMSPKGNDHELVKTALADRWYRPNLDDVDSSPLTTFRLSEDTYLEPDVVIYPRASGIRGLNAATTCLLVVEIANSRCATIPAERPRYTQALVLPSSGSSTRFD